MERRLMEDLAEKVMEILVGLENRFDKLEVRLDGFDDRLDEQASQIETMRFFNNRIGVDYMPTLPRYAPTGSMATEPREYWQVEHPFRR